MKSYFILSAAALAAGSLFSSDQPATNKVDNLVVRAIDPKSMEPTRLSVLSVLKTGIPCSAHYPEATGEMEEWYSKLPADVKSLLPSLYPASATGPASVSAPGSADKLAMTDVFTAACSASGTTTTTTTTQVTVTKTVHAVGSATAASNSSTVTIASNGTTSTANGTGTLPSPTNGTLTSGTATPTLFTGGSGEMEAFAMLTWLFVFAVFVLFL